MWDTGATTTTLSKDVAEALGLKHGNAAQSETAGGVTDGWESQCIVQISPSCGWFKQVQVLPNLGVPMLVGMDIINLGDFSLTHKDGGYIFEFAPLKK